MLSKFYITLTTVLIMVIIGMYFTIKTGDAALMQAQVDNFKLSDKLKAMVSVTGNTVKIMYKDKEVIKYVNTYVPPENTNVTVTTDTNDHIVVNYSRTGVGFYPLLGFCYDNGLNGLIGARLVYFDRFGAGVSISPNATNLFLDSRLDLPMFKNSSVGLFYNSLRSFGVSYHVFL